MSSSEPKGLSHLDFMEFCERMTASLTASTEAAAELPEKSDMGFHRTLDRKFAKGIDATGERIMDIANSILKVAAQSPSLDSKADGKKVAYRPLEDEDTVVDHFRSVVTEIVDQLLENADRNLDEANGEHTKERIQVNASLAAQAGKKLPGPQGLTAKAALPSGLFHAKGIAKPQLAFKDAINNSGDVPWTPTLPIKHHAMVGLSWKPSAEDMPTYSPGYEPTPEKRERDIRMRDHPYFYETKHLPYPTSMFTSAPAIPPKSFEETPFEFIDTPERLAELTKVLKKAKEIAVDLEANSIRSYYGITCLMQISTREGDWVVDTLALRAELRADKLGGVFADPRIVKVLHGADSDIIWLERDFDIYIVNLFDTYHACKVLEFPQFSLASLLKLYCDFDADKRYQMADWRIRPIPEEMLAYARSDTHFLLYIFDNLRNALIARCSRTPSPVDGETDGKVNPQRAIRQVLDRSAETALKLPSRDPYDWDRGTGQNGWSGLGKKLGKSPQPEVFFVFKHLHIWRDALARELDEAPHWILQNNILTDLARLRPRNRAVLVQKLTTKVGKQHIDEVGEVINKAIADFEAGAADVEMQDASRRSTPAGASTPGPSRKKAKTNRSPPPAAPSTRPSVDMWADVIMGNTQTRRASSSALFGATAPATPATAAPVAIPAASSSLFGSTIGKQAPAGPRTQPRDRLASPAFAAIQAAIHSELAPKQSAAVEATSTSTSALTSGTDAPEIKTEIQPETVQFVPAAKRTNVQSAVGAGVTAAGLDAATFVPGSISSSSSNGVDLDNNNGSGSSGAAATSAPKPLVDAEGIVSVKKAKNKAKKKAAAAATAEGDVPASTSAVPAKVTRAKVQPEAIPEFDYAAEPDLLDNPTAASRVARRPKKQPKDKKKPSAGLDTSGFRRAPADPTAPKSGNRQHTF